MSYCTAIVFRENKQAEGVEYRNAWGGHAYVWDKLYDKYLKDPRKEYDCWLNGCRGDDRRLWDLWKDERLDDVERALLLSTFDRALVEGANLSRFADDCEEFVRRYPPGERVCHLLAYATFARGLTDAQALGFYGTSVAENPWTIYPDDEEDDAEPTLYDLATGTKHFYVYESIKERVKRKSGGES